MRATDIDMMITIGVYCRIVTRKTQRTILYSVQRLGQSIMKFVTFMKEWWDEARNIWEDDGVTWWGKPIAVLAMTLFVVALWIADKVIKEK